MTTIVGIRHLKIPFGVLVADRQSTVINDNTGMPEGKYLERKLWKSKDGLYCFGHAGIRDRNMEELTQNLAEGKLDVERIIRDGDFPELRELNINRMGRKTFDNEKASWLVLMTRFNKGVNVYCCSPLGHTGDTVFSYAGSGGMKIVEYMNAFQIMSRTRDYFELLSKIKPEEVVRTGLEAVKRAQRQDLYSLGLDMMVCTPEGLVDHYEDLKEGDSSNEKLDEIQGKYKDIGKKG